jgi:hypothetical protein
VQFGIGREAEADEVAEATFRLRRELLELDVEAVEPTLGGEAPQGSRAVDLVGLGVLVVTVARSEVLSGVVSAIQTWLAGRHSGGTVRLEIAGDVLELTGVSSDEQRRLADAWLRRHVKR